MRPLRVSFLARKGAQSEIENITGNSKNEPANQLFVGSGIGLNPAYLQRRDSLMPLLTLDTAKSGYGFNG